MNNRISSSGGSSGSRWDQKSVWGGGLGGEQCTHPSPQDLFLGLESRCSRSLGVASRGLVQLWLVVSSNIRSSNSMNDSISTSVGSSGSRRDQK